MTNYSSFALRLQKAWQRCQALPAGDRVFSLLVGKIVPYSGSIGARITRAILVKIEMEYLKKARGELSVSCQCQLPTDNSAQDWPIQADIKDSSGDTVASCTATWRVGA